ncbi:MAG TPA: hypothetical protein VMU83_10120 [Hanamia sp.]|nr:hypothetical protein [Hanamia sp.]
MIIETVPYGTQRPRIYAGLELEFLSAGTVAKFIIKSSLLLLLLNIVFLPRTLPPKVQIPVSQRMLKKYGKDIPLCPKCNKGKLILMSITYAEHAISIFTKRLWKTEKKVAAVNNKASPDEKKEAFVNTDFSFIIKPKKINQLWVREPFMSKQNKYRILIKKMILTDMHKRLIL